MRQKSRGNSGKVLTAFRRRGQQLLFYKRYQLTLLSFAACSCAYIDYGAFSSRVATCVTSKCNYCGRTFSSGFMHGWSCCFCSFLGVSFVPFCLYRVSVPRNAEINGLGLTLITLHSYFCLLYFSWRLGSCCLNRDSENAAL